jgi:hypothetical protein
MPLRGTLRVCLFLDCSAPPANLTVPLTPVGAGGSTTASGAVLVTVTGASWTTASAMDLEIPGVTSTYTGYAHGPSSAPSSTARIGGVVHLVTPIVISTNIAADGPLPGFAFLTIRFVPEPATAILVAAGIGVLAALGRRRARVNAA